MNLYFTPEQISDHDEKSHALTRFIAALSAEQARRCIEHELKHHNRKEVLALLASQVAAKLPVREAMVDHAPRADITLMHLGPAAQAQILNALQLSRAHVRCPLEGQALTDLRASLDSALALFGVR